jgi:hypothetical protein
LDNVMQRTAAKRVVAIAGAAAVAIVLLAVTHTSRAAAEVQALTQTTKRSTAKTTATSATSTTPSTDLTITTPIAPGQTAPNGGPLLVPGASDAPASGGNDVKNSDNTGTVVALVITGLLVVALLIALLTYWFWRNTRPPRPPNGPEPEPETQPKPKLRRKNAETGDESEVTGTRLGSSKSDEPAGAN